MPCPNICTVSPRIVLKANSPGAPWEKMPTSVANAASTATSPESQTTAGDGTEREDVGSGTTTGGAVGARAGASMTAMADSLRLDGLPPPDDDEQGKAQEDRHVDPEADHS